MPQGDLFLIAEQSGPDLDARYAKSFPDQAPSSAGHRLCEAVAHRGRVSLNTRPENLRRILESGRFRNEYDLAEEEARRTGRDREQLRRERLGRWYEPRTEFEARVGGGSRLLYGALNIGGLGAPRYGSFCVVTSRRAARGESRLAFLQEDSLIGFRSPDGTLDDASLRRGIATPCRAGRLAALKHEDALAGTRDAEWSSMMCADTCYIEAALSDAPTVQQIEEVRVSSAEMSRIQASAREVLGQRVSSSDALDVHQLARIRQELAKLRISLTEVHE